MQLEKGSLNAWNLKIVIQNESGSQSYKIHLDVKRLNNSKIPYLNVDPYNNRSMIILRTLSLIDFSDEIKLKQSQRIWD